MSARAYFTLFVIALIAAAGVTALGQRPGAHVAPVVRAPAEVREVVRLTLSGRAVSPDRSRVRLGSRVAAHVWNADRAAHALSLAGYDDRVGAIALAPRDSATVTFLADRPGEDFAWLVDGQPAGVLVVAGSHLVEGHR